jgi:signal peptidase I
MASSLKFEKIPTPAQIARYTSPSLLQEIREYVSYFLKVFLVVAIIYIFIRTSIYEQIKVSGQSMYPTFNSKTSDDVIYIDLLTPKFSEYKRGDVVVLIAPEKCDRNKSFYIKRIIGLPGEQVVFENGGVYIINEEHPAPGVLLNESVYLNQSIKTYKNPRGNDGKRYEEKKLADDEYFFMGDNRSNSADGRVCGEIKKDKILGKQFFRLTPTEKRGSFNLPKYNIGNQN